MKRVPILWLMAFLVVGGTRSAVAEPYIVLPNSALALDFEGDFFTFVGDGFVVNQSRVENVGLFFPRTSDASCDPCRVGDTFDPGFRTTGEVLLGSANASFGSTTYSGLTLYGTLDVDATPIAFPGGPADGFEVRTPFTFNGFLRGMAGGEQAFAAAFTGRGTALRFFYARFEDGRYGAGENKQLFLFEAAGPTPVPEPGTIGLFGAGAAMAGFIRWRRQRAAV